MTLQDVHRQFVQDVDELAKQNSAGTYDEIGALVRRLLPIGRKDPARFLEAMQEISPLLLKAVLREGSRVRKSALDRGLEFAAIKLVAAKLATAEED